MDLAQALTNLVNGLVQPVWHFIMALAGFLGVFYLLRIMWKVVQANTLPGRPAVSGGEVAIAIVIAAVFVNYGVALQHVSGSLGLGAVSYSAIDYPAAQQFGQLAPAVNAVFTLALLGGGFYALKGLMMINRAATGAGHAGEDLGWKGLTHVLAGTALINLVHLIGLLRQSTGGLW